MSRQEEIEILKVIFVLSGKMDKEFKCNKEYVESYRAGVAISMLNNLLDKG